MVWRENQSPGKVATLEAKDNDGSDNGPPFTYSLGSEASADIKRKFSIKGNLNILLLLFKYIFLLLIGLHNYFINYLLKKLCILKVVSFVCIKKYLFLF